MSAERDVIAATLHINLERSLLPQLGWALLQASGIAVLLLLRGLSDAIGVLRDVVTAANPAVECFYTAAITVTCALLLLVGFGRVTPASDRAMTVLANFLVSGTLYMIGFQCLRFALCIELGGQKRSA